MTHVEPGSTSAAKQGPQLFSLPPDRPRTRIVKEQGTGAGRHGARQDAPGEQTGSLPCLSPSVWGLPPVARITTSGRVGHLRGGPSNHVDMTRGDGMAGGRRNQRRGVAARLGR